MGLKQKRKQVNDANQTMHCGNGCKVLISIALGLLSLVLSPYGINVKMGDVVISYPWTIVLPIFTSMAFGWRYGLIASIAGAAWFPFLLWPDNGWANILTAIIYLITFTFVGVSDPKTEKTLDHRISAKKFTVIFFSCLMLLFGYLFVFNPLLSLNPAFWTNKTLLHLDKSLLLIFFIKDAINLFISFIISETLLRQPFLRRLLGLPMKTFMKVNGQILIMIACSILVLWLVFIGLDHALLGGHDGFLDGHITLAFIILMLAGFLAARTIMFFTEKQLISEELILESEQSLKLQFQLMPDACIVWNTDKTIRSWNPGAEKIFGYTADEVIGKLGSETIVPKTAQVDGIWEKVLVDKVIALNVNENVTKGGEIILCDWANSPLEDHAGNMTGVISIVKDVTEKVKIEEMLQFLAQKGSSISGQDFLTELVLYMGEFLGADYIIIDTIVENGKSAKTLALYTNGDIGQNFEYKLAGTPCEIVMDKTFCIYPQSLQSHFPQDELLVTMQAESYIGVLLWDSKGQPIGLIAIMNKKAFSNVDFYKTILKLVATRVGVEIERFNFEASLQKSQYFFKESQRTAHIGSYIADFKVGLWESSEILDQIFGIDEHYVRSVPGWIDIVHPADQESMTQYLQEEVIGKRLPFNKEYRIVRKSDGVTRWVSGYGQAAFDEAGNIISLIGTIQDITDRKGLEHSLKGSLALLDSSLESTADGILIVDNLGRVTKCNQKFKQIWGISDELILNQDDSQLTGAMLPQLSAPDQFLEKNKYLYDHPDESSFDQLEFIDGRTIERYSQSHRVNDEVVGRVWSFRDISDRKRAENKLMESEIKLSTLFSAMTEMVVLHEVVFNETGVPVNYRIVDCNDAYTEITGISREDALGKLATEVYQTDSPPYFQEFTKVGITGEPYEYTTYYAPMDKHFLISVVSPQKNSFATITTDITAIQQIQEVIHAKNKELENYLYVASHDLRSPLVNIQGFSQRLQKQTDAIKSYLQAVDLPSDTQSDLDAITLEGIPKTLGFISANVQKMDTLINGLLQISRTGRIKLTISKIDMNQLVNNIVAAYQYQISEKRVAVEVENLPACYGDEAQLNQLFSNLIENALKYADAIRPLSLYIKGQTHYNKVIYSIQDTGIGIPDRHIEKIWEVFYRVDSSLPGSGEGIGLSLVKRITDKHKGRVWVQSKPGAGSTFFVELQKTKFTE
jgi:PAS domain S-box-containing protein